MRLHLATSLLAGGGGVSFVSVVDAKRAVVSHVPGAGRKHHALNADHQQEIRTQGGGGRWAKRQKLKRQVRRLKSTLKVDEDLDRLLKVDQDQQAGEDVGILSYQKAGDMRNSAIDPSFPSRLLQNRDFCECVEYGYAVEEEQCFDTAVAGCKLEGPYADSPPTGCGGPYVASYCQYYECLDSTFGSFDAFQAASNEEQQACMCAYYASVCYLCSPRENGEDPLIDPDDDFCKGSNAYCQIATCCEEAPGASEKSACIDDLDEVDDSDGPTFEPTMEAPDVGIDSFLPTLSPTMMKAEDTPVPTTAVTAAQPSLEEIAPPTSVPTVVIITSSPTEDDDTTSSPTGVPDVPTLIPTAQPTEVVEAATDAPTEGTEGATTPSPKPSLSVTPPSTSTAALIVGRNHAASGLCLTIALVGYISLVF